MQKERLAEIYRAHHEREGRYGYLYCHGERGPYLRDWIGTGKRVLDLGCRDGLLTAFFASHNEIVGVDIDQKALDLASKRLSIETLWLDLNEEWPFGPASFDVIVACELIEHLFLLRPFLERVAATLREGGLFLGSVPNAFRLRNRWKFFFGKEYETDPTHMRQFSYKRLEQELALFFSGIEIVPLQGKILPFLPVSQKFPKCITRLFAKDLLFHGCKR